MGVGVCSEVGDGELIVVVCFAAFIVIVPGRAYVFAISCCAC